MLQPSDPRYTDVPARWVAFEEVARALSDEGNIFSSMFYISRFFLIFIECEGISVFMDVTLNYAEWFIDFKINVLMNYVVVSW